MLHALIVEDSHMTRLYYREILERAQFSVDEAINGLEGLEKTLSTHFDLIILDVNMPKMDGYAFLEQVRQREEICAVPVMMISTEAKAADRAKAYAVGANLYLAKPVAPERLEKCAQLMAGSTSGLRG